MLRTGLAAAAVLALTAIGAPASAQSADSRWFVHVGPALVDLDEDASMTAGGAPVPGANISVDSEITAEIEVGYFIAPHIAVAVAGGWPPTFEVNAAGSLAALGKVGEIQGGPAAVLAQWHFTPQNQFQPYVGAGVGVMYIFSEDDGALTNLHTDNAVGLAVQAGANFMVNERWGIFLDVKKAWMETETTGTLMTLGGPAPVRAQVQLDPMVVNGGVTFRF